MTTPDRIDAAARAILARRAEELTTSWESARTTAAGLGLEQDIDARLREHAQQIRVGGRCANCDHQTRFHSEGGCWFTLTTGKPDANLVCPCATEVQP